MSYIIYVVLSIVILLHAFVVDSQLKLFYNIRKGSAFPVTIYKSCIKHCSAEPRNEDGEDDEYWVNPTVWQPSRANRNSQQHGEAGGKYRKLDFRTLSRHAITSCQSPGDGK